MAYLENVYETYYTLLHDGTYNSTDKYLIDEHGYILYLSGNINVMECLDKNIHLVSNKGKKIRYLLSPNYMCITPFIQENIYIIIEKSQYRDHYKYDKFQAVLPEPKTRVAQVGTLSKDIFFNNLEVDTIHSSSTLVSGFIHQAFHRIITFGAKLPPKSYSKVIKVDFKIDHLSNIYKNYEEVDESYTLDLSDIENNKITITSNQMWGAQYALITLFQLIEIKYNGSGNSYCFPHGTSKMIHDNPKYKFRGISLDTARNYIKHSTILKHISVMEMFKFNVFHWHIADSTSFPLNVPGYEHLYKTGAYHTEDTYDMSFVNLVIEYAKDRGIEVILEIDTPGHSNIFGLSQHSNTNPPVVWNKYHNEATANSNNTIAQPSNYSGFGWNTVTIHNNDIPLSYFIKFNLDDENQLDVNPERIRAAANVKVTLYNNPHINDTWGDIYYDTICLNNESCIGIVKINFTISDNVNSVDEFNNIDNFITNNLLLNIQNIQFYFGQNIKEGTIYETNHSTPGTPEPPSAAIDIYHHVNNNSTSGTIIGNLFTTIIKQLHSAYHIHLGGDEIVNNTTSAFMETDLIRYFNTIVNAITKVKAIKNTISPKIIMWQEALFSSRNEISPLLNQVFIEKKRQIIIHNWASLQLISDQQSQYEKLNNVYNNVDGKNLITFVMSPGTQYYLDGGESDLRGQGVSWNGLRRTWQSLLLYEPRAYTKAATDTYNVQRSFMNMSGHLFTTPSVTPWTSSADYLKNLHEDFSGISSNLIKDNNNNPVGAQDITEYNTSHINYLLENTDFHTIITGGSLLVWTECISDGKLDSAMWPKAIGGAYSLWGIDISNEINNIKGSSNDGLTAFKENIVTQTKSTTTDNTNFHTWVPPLSLNTKPYETDWTNQTLFYQPLTYTTPSNDSSYIIFQKNTDIPEFYSRKLLNYTILPRIMSLNNTIQELYGLNSNAVYSFYAYNPPQQQQSMYAQLKTICYAFHGQSPEVSLDSSNICSRQYFMDHSSDIIHRIGVHSYKHL